MMFWQHGAAAHFDIVVRRYLDERLGKSWIGKNSPVASPQLSADLTTLLFSWDYMK